MVLTSKLQDRARPIIDEFLRRTGVEIVPFTDEHYRVAVSAFQRYGKGRHPAALDFGDCLSYAVARLSGMPLLFTGDGFSKTDIPR
jgi:ribonuclease VapC